jgi:hypothetical protein
MFSLVIGMRGDLCAGCRSRGAGKALCLQGFPLRPVYRDAGHTCRLSHLAPGYPVLSQIQGFSTDGPDRSRLAPKATGYWVGPFGGPTPEACWTCYGKTIGFSTDQNTFTSIYQKGGN